MRVGVQVTGKKNTWKDLYMSLEPFDGHSIPIKCWSEIDNALALFSLHAPADIRSQGGRTYLVTTQNPIKQLVKEWKPVLERLREL